MPLSTESFLATYRDLGTEELLQLIVTRPLTEEAQDAARMVLLERGVVGHELERQHVEALKGMVRSAGVTNQCDFCGQSLVMGAIHDQGQRFCGAECRDEARLLEASVGLAPDLVLAHANAILMGPCPCCGRQGKPIEVRPRWLIVSAILYVSRNVERTLSCRRCAQRKNWWAIASCLLLGWWSVPGLFETPVAIYRNLTEIYARRIRKGPSEELIYRAKLDLAKQLIEPMGMVAAMGRLSRDTS